MIADGNSVPVGISGQRLVGLLSLNDRPMSRLRCAAIMWPDVVTARAGANLRSVVWRLQRSCPGVVYASQNTVRLGTDVVIDARRWSETAYRLIDKSRPMDQDELDQARDITLHAELLPELGDEEWLISERARYRQIGLHALEALSERLLDGGWFGAAVDVGLAAVKVDPLRESGHRVLVSAYLAEGNVCEAYRQYHSYRDLLRAELGVEPSSQFEDLLQHVPKIRRSQLDRLQMVSGRFGERAAVSGR
jgi:DNA-binding SARP family transcriptional activator